MRTCKSAWFNGVEDLWTTPTPSPMQIPNLHAPPPLLQCKYLTLPTSGSIFKGTVLPIFPSSRVKAFISINSNSWWGSTRNHDLMGFKVCEQLLPPPPPTHPPHTLPWATCGSIFEDTMQHIFQQQRMMINEQAWFNGVEWLNNSPPPLHPPTPPLPSPQKVFERRWQWQHETEWRRQPRAH